MTSQDSDDRQAILDAVTGFFERDGGVRRNATGKLLAYSETVRSLTANFPGTVISQDFSIKRLEVVHVGDQVAVAELEAESRLEGVNAAGEKEVGLNRFSGPVEVVRVGSEWKVADLFKNGLSLRQSTFDTDIAERRLGIKLNALMGRREKRFIRLLLEVQNDSDVALPVLGSAFGRRLRRWSPWVWSPRVLVSLEEIPPGAARFVVDPRAEDDQPIGRLRLLLRTPDGVLDVRPPGIRARKRLPHPKANSRTTFILLVLTSFPFFAAAGLLGLFFPHFMDGSAVAPGVVVLYFAFLSCVWMLVRPPAPRASVLRSAFDALILPAITAFVVLVAVLWAFYPSSFGWRDLAYLGLLALILGLPRVWPRNGPLRRFWFPTFVCVAGATGYIVGGWTFALVMVGIVSVVGTRTPERIARVVRRPGQSRNLSGQRWERLCQRGLRRRR